MRPPPGSSQAPMPRFLAPMLATHAPLPKKEPEWAFEVKWDGVRALAHCEPARLRILGRRGGDISAAYPELGGLLAALHPHAALLDGEIVALERSGRPSFELLQRRMQVRSSAVAERLSLEVPVTYMIFDLLWLDGRRLLGLPYTERRAALEQLALNGQFWRTPESFIGQGSDLLAATRERGLEGVVGKRLDSAYVSGRHRSWIKVKNRRRQRLVIGGYTPGRGARSGQLGALLVGVEDDAGSLRYAGAVGSGFSHRELTRLAALLAPLEQRRTPFAGRQPPREARFVEPRFLCEVEFSEWTRSGTLRQASFRGLAGERVEALRRTLEIGGRQLALTNLNKVLYPDSGLTKGELIAYYRAVAPVLLPHLRDRPLTLKRYPDGVRAPHFYEKRAPAHSPAWVRTASVPGAGGAIRYTLCQDAATLVWLANLATVELHPLLCLAQSPGCPTAVVFDLDPGEGAGVSACCRVALLVRDLLEQLELRSWVKTSGSKGLHVLVPLNDPVVGFAQTKAFARAVATLLQERHPDLVVANMSRARRRARVLIDWSQNDPHKTTVSVYSLRATRDPTVSAPFSWGEVEASAHEGAPLPGCGPEQVLSRIAADGDLFENMLGLVQRLPNLEG